MTAAAIPAPRVRTFFGHPIGLGYLVFAEGWERFSYYGMQSLLVLYMGQQLLLPGHVEHVAGFATFRGIIESAYGHLTPAALASVIFGLYAGGVYLTPLAGGFVADRWLGRTRTVALGAVLMAIGHFLMAFEVSFLLALSCLLVGVGCFKGNIASQVGELYAPGDLRRADAFQVFLLAVNVAVIVSPLVCGTLGQKVAWHWGFGAAGVGMLIGLAVYLSGRRWLPPERVRQVRGEARVARPRLARGEAKTIAVLVAMLPVLALSGVGNQEIFNAYLVWGQANYDLVFFGQTMPVTWLISLDAIISSATIVASVAFWRWWSKKRTEPQEITKLAIGALIAGLAPLALTVASLQQQATGHKIGLFYIVKDIGFANIFPVGIALFSRAGPRAILGLIIGVYYLNIFAGNMLVGYLGGLLVPLGGPKFWALHAALVFGAGVALLVFRALFRNTLSPTVDPEAVEDQP
jgi:POT family proton-dependent oligopeptide transporter